MRAQEPSPTPGFDPPFAEFEVPNLLNEKWTPFRTKPPRMDYLHNNSQSLIIIFVHWTQLFTEILPLLENKRPLGF